MISMIHSVLSNSHTMSRHKNRSKTLVFRGINHVPREIRCAQKTTPLSFLCYRVVLVMTKSEAKELTSAR